MKRFVSICMFIIFLMSGIALADTQDGKIKIGNTGMVVLLPNGMATLQPYPEELVAAKTPDYSAPNGAYLTVTNYGFVSSDQLLALHIQAWDPDDASMAAVDQTFASYENENAFHDWIHSWNGSKSSQYLEVGQRETSGQRIPYFLCFDSLKGPETLEGTIIAFVSDDQATYAFKLTRLFQVDTSLTPEKLDKAFFEYLSELHNSIGTILCASSAIPSDWSYQKYNEQMTIFHLSTDGSTEKSGLWLDAYNQILDTMSSQGSLSRNDPGETFNYLTENTDTLLKPTIYHSYENQQEDIEQTLNTFLSEMMDTVSWLENYEGYEDKAPIADKTLFEEDGRGILIDKLYMDESWPCNAISFTLRDENEELLENNTIYILARVYVENRMAVWLITDQAIVDEYLNLVGQSKAGLLGIEQKNPIIPNVSPDFDSQVTADSDQSFILEEHKQIADDLKTDGYSSYTNDEHQFYYGTQKNNKMLQPMIITLSDERAAIRGTEVIVEDLQTMLDVALQYEADGETSPIAPELIERIQKDGYVIDPLCYYGGDIELIVFGINGASDSERLDEQIYAATRIPDENGGIQLGLITDEEKIEQGIKDLLAQNAAGFEVFMPSNAQTESEHIHAFAIREVTDQKYAKVCILCGHRETVEVSVNATLSPEEQVKEAERQLAYLQFEQTNDYFWNENAQKVTTSINDDTWVEYINTAWSSLNHFGDEAVKGFNYAVEYGYGVITGEQSLTLEEILTKGGPGAALVKEIYQSNQNDIYVLEWEKLLIETLQGYHTVAQEQHESIDPEKLSGAIGAVKDIADLAQKGVELKAQSLFKHWESVNKLSDELYAAFKDKKLTADQLKVLNKYMQESDSARDSAYSWNSASSNANFVLEYAGIALQAYSDFNDIQEHEKKLEEFASLLIEYEQNLYILQSISESTNSPELQKACSNVANDLTNLLWDPESFVYRENNSYSTEYVLSSALEVMKGASPLGILTLPDAFGQWDAAHLSGLQLQTLSVMDASIKDEAYNAATNNSTDDYYLTELYRVLQLNGLNQSKDYVNKFDDAWGINASDLGISNVNSYIEAIDDQIIRNVELQNNLLREYNETLNQ